MSNFNPQFQRIGDILVHNDVISQNDLTRALNDQKTSNEKIGAILIKLGCINAVSYTHLTLPTTPYV